MKTPFLLISFCAFISVVNAQEINSSPSRFSLSARSSVLLNRCVILGDEDNMRSNAANWGYDVGLNVSWRTGSIRGATFIIETGLNYLKTGGTFRFPEYFPLDEIGSNEYQIGYNASFISLPLNFRAQFGNKKWINSVEAGISFDRGINMKRDYIYTDSIESTVFKNVDVLDDFHPMAISGTFSYLLSYSLSERWITSFELGCRQNLVLFNKEEWPISFGSIRSGVRITYHF